MVADPVGGRRGDGRRRRAPRRRAALGVAAVLVVVIAVCAAGAAGLVVALSCVAVIAAAGGAAAGARGPATPARGRAGPPVENAPFRSYRAVAEALSWADGVAAALRPGHPSAAGPAGCRSRLADHHRVDLAADPEAARALVGEDVWPWLDPGPGRRARRAAARVSTSRR